MIEAGSMSFKIISAGVEIADVERFDEYHATVWNTAMTARDGVALVVATQEEYISKYFTNGVYPNPTALIEYGFGNTMPSTSLYDLQNSGQMGDVLANPRLTLFRLEMVSFGGSVAIAFDQTPGLPTKLGVISTFDDSEVVASMAKRGSLLKGILENIYHGLPRPS